MGAQNDIEKRVKRLEDREEIRTLVARYGLAVDDRDMDALSAMFTDDASFGSRDGKVEGRDAVLDIYYARLGDTGPSFHFAHDHFIWFEDNEDEAKGIVTAHVELVRGDDPMLIAMRYEDTYRRDGGSWRFAERIASFLYYLKASEYLERLPTEKRMCASDEPVEADWPEAIPTWQSFQKNKKVRP